MISMILKLTVNTLKLCAFAAVVLIASHLIHWNGKTISDQVKITLSSEEPKAWMKRAEKNTHSIAEEAKVAAGKIADGAPEKARAWIQAKKENADSMISNPRSDDSREESISDTEKNELSSLIEN